MCYSESDVIEEGMGTCGRSNNNERWRDCRGAKINNIPHANTHTISYVLLEQKITTNPPNSVSPSKKMQTKIGRKPSQ